MLYMPDATERERLAAREVAIRDYARTLLAKIHAQYERGLLTTEEYAQETLSITYQAIALVDAN
jgi:hypothetical protein